jgi:multiple sugar transport system permease protein
MFLSLNRVDLTGLGWEYTWIGMDNYITAFFGNIDFVPALLEFIVLEITYVPAIVIFSFILGTLLNRELKFRGGFRTIFFLPVIVLSGSVMDQLINAGGTSLDDFSENIVFKMLLNYSEFLAETMLQLFTNFTLVLWFTGIPIILFINGLQKISRSLFEAARIDGATGWQILWKITIPIIKPTALIVTIFTIVQIGMYNINPIYSLIQTSMYNFQGGLGLASSYAFVYTLVVLIFVGVGMFILRTKPDNLDIKLTSVQRHRFEMMTEFRERELREKREEKLAKKQAKKDLKAKIKAMSSEELDAYKQQVQKEKEAAKLAAQEAKEALKLEKQHAKEARALEKQKQKEEIAKLKEALAEVKAKLKEANDETQVQLKSEVAALSLKIKQAKNPEKAEEIEIKIRNAAFMKKKRAEIKQRHQEEKAALKLEKQAEKERLAARTQEELDQVKAAKQEEKLARRQHFYANVKRTFTTRKYFTKFVGVSIIYILLITISYVFLFPLLNMVSLAFMSPEDVINVEVDFVPRSIYFGNFIVAMQALDGVRSLFNSIWFSGTLAIAQTIISALTGFAFARYDFRFKKILFALILVSFIVPVPIIFIPRLMMFISAQSNTGIKLIGTVIPQLTLALFGQGVNSAILILIFYNFFRLIPNVLYEAARIDGASAFKQFWEITIKMSLSTIVVVFLFSLVWNWNETYVTNQLLGDNMKVLPLQLGIFDTLFASRPSTNVPGQDGVARISEAYRMAATFISMVPLFILYFVAQKQFVEGIEKTGITGE